MRRPIINALALVLATGSASPALAAQQLLSNFGGIFICIFLAYCALIVVAQLFAAVAALKRAIIEHYQKKALARELSADS